MSYKRIEWLDDRLIAEIRKFFALPEEAQKPELLPAEFHRAIPGRSQADDQCVLFMMLFMPLPQGDAAIADEGPPVCWDKYMPITPVSIGLMMYDDMAPIDCPVSRDEYERWLTRSYQMALQFGDPVNDDEDEDEEWELEN